MLRVGSRLGCHASRVVLDALRVVRFFVLFLQPLRLSTCSDVPLALDALRVAWLAVLFLRLIHGHLSPLLSVRAGHLRRTALCIIRARAPVSGGPCGNRRLAEQLGK